MDGRQPNTNGGEEPEQNPNRRAFTGHPDHPPSSPDQPADGNEELLNRLEDEPENEDAQLDVALDETMDASDPPATTQPGGDEPAPSSGYRERDR